ncbi:hypothetical protein ACHAW5_008121 [Stephanodiscus triporus]|uniref:Uncharacterized protein n=1 Tax=Stephanodiscus triporus TaxID=2934178 RepID=A0ABD3NI28_9STRA
MNSFTKSILVMLLAVSANGHEAWMGHAGLGEDEQPKCGKSPCNNNEVCCCYPAGAVCQDIRVRIMCTPCCEVDGNYETCPADDDEGIWEPADFAPGGLRGSDVAVEDR